jgi:hypothetical protein
MLNFVKIPHCDYAVQDAAFEQFCNRSTHGSTRKRKTMKQLLTFVGMCLLFTGSCRSPNSPTPLRAPGLQTPVATGLFITLEDGPVVVAVFGNPSSNPTFGSSNAGRLTTGDLPTRFYLHVPYPNPNNGGAAIHFQLPTQSTVTVYIVPAGFMSPEGRIIQFSNATISVAGGLAIDVLVDRNLPAGVHAVNWSGRDQDGQPLPDGFYRIYAEINGHLLWQDALLLRDPCNAPPGLPPSVAGWCR